MANVRRTSFAQPNQLRKRPDPVLDSMGLWKSQADTRTFLDRIIGYDVYYPLVLSNACYRHRTYPSAHCFPPAWRHAAHEQSDAVRNSSPYAVRSEGQR